MRDDMGTVPAWLKAAPVSPHPTPGTSPLPLSLFPGAIAGPILSLCFQDTDCDGNDAECICWEKLVRRALSLYRVLVDKYLPRYTAQLPYRKVQIRICKVPPDLL